jgi:muramoyltetrapeptide carboxypeptidase LdcA involved in peptidoglycan recycling
MYRYPDKPRPGDAVAIVSPSSGMAARFPRPYELGLARIRDEFGLRPVEYPATRAPAAAPAERAADLHAAFADPEIKAVITAIGGDDERKVLAHLKPDVFAASPKARFTQEQRDAVLAAVTEYHPSVPLVFGVDFGHTEPQHIIPSGGEVTVDGETRQLHVTY